MRPTRIRVRTMGTSIDEIANRIVSSFNEENTVILKNETKNMIFQINNYESLFSVIKKPYLVAKSLFIMLSEGFLTEDDRISCIRLAYYCLLMNYINNIDKKPTEPEYEDLVSGSKLALVLISMQNQYLMYSIIAGQAHYINPQTHIRNQTLLFGGIAKEAENAHFIFPLEGIINKYFMDVFHELSDYLPSGRDLANLKENYTPVIKNIKTSISINLNDSWSDEF